ncbi:MAG: MFS transporter [Eubacteriales bacterium]
MNNTKKSARILIVMLWISYAAIYVGRKNFSVCMAGMVTDGIIDKLIGGTAGTAFLAVYACGQLVNGLIGDRISPKLMITVGLFGAGAANVFMGLVVYPAAVPVIWGICGFFCSMLWSPVVRCISEWIPENERSSAGVNISVTLPVGSMVSYITCSVMMHYFSWREAFFACAFILFAACAVFLSGFISIREYIKDAGLANRNRREALFNNEKAGTHKNPTGIPRLIILTGLTWVIAGILFNGVLKDGLDLWVPTCITEYFGMSASVSSLLTGILPIVNLAGVFTARRINDRFFRNEVATAAFMFGVSLISFIPLLAVTVLAQGNGSIFMAVIAVLLISVTSSSMLGVNIMLLTFIPFRFNTVGHSSGVTGFLNFCSYAAASLSGITIGLISSNFGWTATIIAFAVCAVFGTAVCAAGARDWKKGSAWLAGESVL